jgi:hypothetical protein
MEALKNFVVSLPADLTKKEFDSILSQHPKASEFASFEFHDYDTDHSRYGFCSYLNVSEKKPFLLKDFILFLESTQAQIWLHKVTKETSMETWWMEDDECECDLLFKWPENKAVTGTLANVSEHKDITLEQLRDNVGPYSGVLSLYW